MEKYAGYEALAINCADIFDELEEEFIKKAKFVIKQRDFYADNEQLEIAFSRAFRALIGINDDAKEILNLVKKCFNNDELLAKYTLRECINDFKDRFAGQANEKYNEFLQNATERFAHIFGLYEELELPEIQSEKEIKTNTLTFSNDGVQLFGDIFDELKTAKADGQELKLLNLYKGVNITSGAKIIDIKENKLYLQTAMMQMLAMREEGFAFILKNGAISSDIMAKISNFDFSASNVILYDFVRSTKTAAILRRHPRVHPRKITPLTLRSNDGNTLQAKLFDISEGGLGAVSEQSTLWVRGEPLHASFELEIDGVSKQISVDVELVVALNYQGSMRYCCEIKELNQPAMNDIIAFARKRVDESIEELRKKADDFI